MSQAQFCRRNGERAGEVLCTYHGTRVSTVTHQTSMLRLGSQRAGQLVSPRQTQRRRTPLIGGKHGVHMLSLLHRWILG